MEDRSALRLPRPKTTFRLFIVIMVVFFTFLVGDSMRDLATDFNLHIRFAEQLVLTGELTAAHILWHLLVILIGHLFPVPLTLRLIFAAQAVTILTYVVTGIMVYRMLVASLQSLNRAEQHVLACLGTLGIMIAQPLIFFTIPDHSIFSAYIAFNLTQTPTTIFVKPFMLLVHQWAVKRITPLNESHQPILSVLFPIILGVVCVYAKPNYALAVLPALIIISAVGLFSTRRLTVFGQLLPIIVGLTIGLMSAYIIQFLMINADDGGIIFAPLSSIYTYDQNLLRVVFKMLASMAFPLVVVVVYFDKARRDPSLVLGWLTFAMALIQLVLFDETGVRVRNGNWWVGAYLTLFLLFVISLRFCFSQISRQPLRWREKIAFGTFFVHCLAGVTYLVIQFTTNDLTTWY